MSSEVHRGYDVRQARDDRQDDPAEDDVGDPTCRELGRTPSSAVRGADHQRRVRARTPTRVGAAVLQRPDGLGELGLLRVDDLRDVAPEAPRQPSPRRAAGLIAETQT